MEGFKDPNEALLAGKGSQIIDAIWGAKTYRPDGIAAGEELWQTMQAEDEVVYSTDYPWQGLNKMTHGLRTAELVVFTAGSGVGKSAVVREVVYSLLRDGETVGCLNLEESVKRSVNGLIGIELNRPIHLDLTPFKMLEPDEQKARRDAFERIGGSSRLYLYDHFGSTDLDNLLAKVRYLVNGCGCRWVVLDHLSIVVSGLDDGDERKTIDLIMTKLRTFVQETKCGLLVISHLKRPGDGKGHEQGAEVSLAQLRGSHSIAQLADMVVGLERNQQDEQTKHITTVRVLKNRFSGETGIATHLSYKSDTGRLKECSLEFGDNTAPQEGDEDF